MAIERHRRRVDVASPVPILEREMEKDDDSPHPLLLGVVLLTAVTGCAGRTGSVVGDPSLRGDGAGPGSSSTLQDRALSCRNRGAYNRAADLCVSEGP